MAIFDTDNKTVKPNSKSAFDSLGLHPTIPSREINLPTPLVMSHCMGRGPFGRNPARDRTDRQTDRGSIDVIICWDWIVF